MNRFNFCPRSSIEWLRSISTSRRSKVRALTALGLTLELASNEKKACKMTNDKLQVFALCVNFSSIEANPQQGATTSDEAVIFYVPAESEEEALKRLTWYLQQIGYQLLNVQWCVDHDDLSESTAGLNAEYVPLRTAREQNRIVREPALEYSNSGVRSEKFVSESQLRSLFEVLPMLVDRDVPWYYNQATYTVEQDHLKLRFSICPAYMDVNIELLLDGLLLYRLNAKGVCDVRHTNQDGLELLEIVLNDFESLVVRVKPRVELSQMIEMMDDRSR